MSPLRFVWTGMLLLSVAAPRLSHGDQFQAPGAIVANPDGSFSYDAEFRKEVAPDFLGGSGWYALENNVGGYSADCFCDPWCVMQPGDSLTIHVDGQLTDPTQPGSAATWVSFCTPNANYGATTIVHPYGTTGVGEPPLSALRLWCAPNPAATGTMLHWVLPASAAVRLRVFDLAGRQVASLVDEVQSPGHHQAAWQAGAATPGNGGVYFARLTAAGESRTQVVVLRR